MIQIFENLENLYNFSGEIPLITFLATETIRFHFHSNNGTNFSGFNVSLQNSKFLSTGTFFEFIFERYLFKILKQSASATSLQQHPLQGATYLVASLRILTPGAEFCGVSASPFIMNNKLQKDIF